MQIEQDVNAGLKLVEELTGIGKLSYGEREFPGVRYDIRRYQGMARSGLPVPGVHRIDGSIDLAPVERGSDLVGRDLTLVLENGRTMRITLADRNGRVLTEGHGPSRCSCC
jgi:hypothetical protein